ncbi:MAG: orotidine-5'-phosphate decarboxylase [Nocardioides sp.]
MTFGARLHAAMAIHGPLCAGVDPHVSLLRAWGYDDNVRGLERFARGAVAAVAPHVAAVKPQSAFFERFGSRGIAVLERVISDARMAGAQVILDVKRGDIGSTSQAYADAYLDQSAPMAVDAITASPYLGFGSLQPMFDTAARHDAGVFVLALTSNPEGAQVQRAQLPPAQSPPAQSPRAETDAAGTVAGSVLDGLRDLNQSAAHWGSFGAVVGATIGATGEDLMINGPLLVPGIGAQGGTAADVHRLFGNVLDTVLPSTSRDLLAAGPDPIKLADRAQRLNAEVRALLSIG